MRNYKGHIAVSKRKKVAFDVTPLLYRQTGIARVTANLLRAFHEIASDYDFVLFGRRLLGKTVELRESNLPIVRLRLPKAAEPLIRHLGLVERMCHAELYHATDFYLPLRDSSIAVATVHDVLFLTDSEGTVDHARLAQWAPAFAKRAAAVIAVSEFTKNQIESVLGVPRKRIHVIHSGVDHDMFSPYHDISDLAEKLKLRYQIVAPYFFAVSCSTGRKNTIFLLDVYLEFLKRNPRHDLVLAWDPPASVRRLYGACPRIRFLGYVDNSDLRLLYSGASAMIFPSLYEGFGLPVLEAMSCGTPVIVSRATSLPEVAGPVGIYMDPREPRSLLEALVAFEDEKVRPASLRKSLLTHAANFTWQQCARKTIEVYDQVFESIQL